MNCMTAREQWTGYWEQNCVTQSINNEITQSCSWFYQINSDPWLPVLGTHLNDFFPWYLHWGPALNHRLRDSPSEGVWSGWGGAWQGPCRASGDGTGTAECGGTASLQGHHLSLYKEEENFIENFVSVQASA